MKSINSESDLIGFIEAALGRPMNDDESARYTTHLAAHDDPRRGYNIIKTRDDLAYWLVECHGYGLTRFVGGIGLTDCSYGGCRGYLSDELVAEMTSAGELQDNMCGWLSSASGPRITASGMSALRKIAGKKWARE